MRPLLILSAPLFRRSRGLRPEGFGVRAAGQAGGEARGTAPPSGRLRYHRQTVPRRELLHLPREQEAGERPQPSVVHLERVARRTSRPVGRGRRQAAPRRDAPARRGTADRGAAPGRHDVARARAGAYRRRYAARSGPRDRAPPQPHRVQQHDQGTARRRHPAGRRLPAGRCRVRIRQHRRRPVALSRPDGEVRLCGGPRRAGGALRTTGHGADAPPPPLGGPPGDRNADDPRVVRCHRAEPAERLPFHPPHPDRRRVHGARRPRWPAAEGLGSGDHRSLGRREADAGRDARSRDTPRRSPGTGRTSAVRPSR